MRYGKYVYVHIQYIDFVRIVPGCQSWWMMKLIKSNIIQVQADPFPLSYIATCAVHYILTQPYFKGVILIVFITMLHTYQNFNVPNYFSRRALSDNGELVQAFSIWLSRISIRAHNSQVTIIMIAIMVVIMIMSTVHNCGFCSNRILLYFPMLVSVSQAWHLKFSQ